MDALPSVNARGRLYGSVLEIVGNTPLVRLPRLEAAEGLAARLALKLEFQNPLGSVKDRIGLAMVETAEREGVIAPGRSILVEPTSGNTGIALAFVAAAKGYKLVVVMPDGASAERQKMLRLMGASLELTPARQGMSGAIARAEAIVAATPGAWMPRQFDNPANPAVHAATTAEEIWADTGGEVDVVVGGIGTGGTLTGIARTLKPRRPGMRVVGVEPGPHDIQGIGAGFCPGVLDLAALDGVVRVSERDALAAARRCAAAEGLPIGISSGAALHAALALARDPALRGGLVVGIAASFAERYLSTELFAGL
jgi:cysteine synthase A